MNDEKKSESELLESTFRNYTWSYFEFHAEQRLKTFHFFVTLAAALVGAFVLLMRYGAASKWMATLGFLLALLTFVFWKLDVRNRGLIKNAESALKFLDAQHNFPNVDGVPHPLRLFTRDDHFTDSAPRYPLWSGFFSYSRSFEWIFLVFAIAGLCSAAWSLWKFPT
jgi:hypothetical protein